MKIPLKSCLLLIALLSLGLVPLLAHEDDPPDPDDRGRPHVHVDDYTFDETLTYYDHIRPILQANCVGCHTEGQISGDIPLDDTVFVQDNAQDIARVTEIRYMPPWMPSEEGLPLRHERTLTEEQIAMMVTWADGGAEMGDPVEDAPVQINYTPPEIRADFVMVLDEPYLPDDQNNDDYRCFAFDPMNEEPIYVTGYVFEPHQTEMVHHGIVYHIPRAYRSGAFNRDGRDGKAGWSCYNTTGLPEEAIIGTWTPGTFPVQYPVNSGFLIEPGDLLVMQIHYNTLITRVPDLTSVTLQFDAADTGVQPLITFDLLAPVEIPCPVGIENELCDRQTSIQDTANRYGSEFLNRPDYLLRECGKTLADYADIDPAHAVSSCEFTSPWNLTAVGVLGHMHELGKSFRLEINPGTPDSQILLDIPYWDFHWQDTYQFAEPVTINRGDVVRMTCVWDNTLSENPRYIVWGEGTQDEMCFGTLTILGA